MYPNKAAANAKYQWDQSDENAVRLLCPLTCGIPTQYCEQCPVNYYCTRTTGETTGALDKTPCPSGYNTRGRRGMTSVDGCKSVLCGKGKMVNGTHCSRCPSGTYRDEVDHRYTACIECTPDEWGRPRYPTSDQTSCRVCVKRSQHESTYGMNIGVVTDGQCTQCPVGNITDLFTHQCTTAPDAYTSKRNVNDGTICSEESTECVYQPHGGWRQLTLWSDYNNGNFTNEYSWVGPQSYRDPHDCASWWNKERPFTPVQRDEFIAHCPSPYRGIDITRHYCTYALKLFIDGTTCAYHDPTAHVHYSTAVCATGDEKRMNTTTVSLFNNGLNYTKTESSACYPCIPGKYLRKGTPPSCETCASGQYQHRYRALSCNNCPPHSIPVNASTFPVQTDKGHCICGNGPCNNDPSVCYRLGFDMPCRGVDITGETRCTTTRVSVGSTNEPECEYDGGELGCQWVTPDLATMTGCQPCQSNEWAAPGASTCNAL
jgi:hypothetical protein